ncbi:meiotic recombination DMC1 LIM15 homolog [Paramuricea clavata]|uniref:Meiotic recombination DMC1 LIM15 homolog n=1 Tax=Paramuricea clavata TaxID=317549 RepID=A0A6S7GKE4_PARCT|nr:meiotic recombination DMC1 LIM15 homolog [Paramuricea clavata]
MNGYRDVSSKTTQASRRDEQVVDPEISDQEEEEESFYLDSDLLQNHGINVADIKKLKTSGIYTIKGVQMTTRRKLCQIKGISEAKMEKIKVCIFMILQTICTLLEAAENTLACLLLRCFVPRELGSVISHQS